MRAEDLHHEELLELDPEGGVIRFAGQRALLLDAVAMGLLRKYLVENFGLTAARTVLTQFGFAHGWRMAEAMHAEFKWNSDDDWQQAGIRIHALEGLFRVETGSKGLLSKEGVTLLASYEAEQHLLHFGRSDVPACWTICGLTSGYVSRSSGKEIYVLEDRCVGKGDAACHLIGRTRHEWGDERAEELRFFEPIRLKECLDVSLQRVTTTLKAAERKLQRHRRALVRVARNVEEPLSIVAKSAAMRQLVDLATRVAKVDSTVLITGESGSGKERVARLLHDLGPRAHFPFVVVDCTTLPDDRAEIELFGAARGAAAGQRERAGLIAQSDRGTLFLDELPALSSSLQSKLLRLLQEGTYRRVGEDSVRRVRLRVVAATNQSVEELLKNAGLKRDLFYRLNGYRISLRPLRARPEEIGPLALEIARRCGLAGITGAALEMLQSSAWPGNVRQLEMALRVAAGQCAVGGWLERQHLESRQMEAGDATTEETLRAGRIAGERATLLRALEEHGGVISQAARSLGLSRQGFYKALRRTGLASV